MAKVLLYYTNNSPLPQIWSLILYTGAILETRFRGILATFFKRLGGIYQTCLIYDLRHSLSNEIFASR